MKSSNSEFETRLEEQT